MEWPREARLLELRVERISLHERMGIRRDDRVERRVLLVVGGDAFEICTHQIVAGELLAPHRRMDLRDRGFLDLECRRRLSLPARERTDPDDTEERAGSESPSHFRPVC